MYVRMLRSVNVLPLAPPYQTVAKPDEMGLLVLVEQPVGRVHHLTQHQHEELLQEGQQTNMYIQHRSLWGGGHVGERHVKEGYVGVGHVREGI